MTALLTVFLQNQSFFLFTVFIFGLLVGSFLNVVIYRLPVMMQRDWKEQCCELLKIDNDNKHSHFDLIQPRSRCQNCRHQITALENIPIISYLFLRGKCRQCKSSISLRYPIIELTAALSAFVVAYQFGVTMQTLFGLILSWSLIVLTMIDIDHQLLPDDITLPMLWLGIVINYFDVFTQLQHSVMGAIFGYGSLWTIYILFRFITGKEGMGHGDFKLLAVFGAWFGWQVLPLIIVLSSVFGTVIGLSMIFFQSHDRNVPVSFGPYLAIAGWIAMLWGSYIMAHYLNAVL